MFSMFHAKSQVKFLYQSPMPNADNLVWYILGDFLQGFRKDDGKGSIHEALKVEFEEEVFGKPVPSASKDEKLNKLWQTQHEVGASSVCHAPRLGAIHKDPNRGTRRGSIGLPPVRLSVRLSVCPSALTRATLWESSCV